MKKRIFLPNDSLVEELYNLCLKCKLDWFYSDYYKTKRKTIEINDVITIYYDIANLGLDMSTELYKWFHDNLNSL